MSLTLRLYPFGIPTRFGLGGGLAGDGRRSSNRSGWCRSQQNSEVIGRQRAQPRGEESSHSKWSETKGSKRRLLAEATSRIGIHFLPLTRLVVIEV